MCALLMLTCFCDWLLEDIPRNILSALIIGTAFALIIYFALEESSREYVTVGDWRQLLYQRVRDDVERLHCDMTMLKQQLDQDKIHSIFYYKPAMCSEYRNKLELLKQELSFFEQSCYGFSKHQNHISQSEVCGLKDKWEEKQKRLQKMKPTAHELYVWQNKCAKEFQQWIQVSEFYDSELHDNKIAKYKLRSCWRSSRDGDMRRRKTRECAGYWPLSAIRLGTVVIEYEMESQTQNDSEHMIGTAELLPSDGPGDIIVAAEGLLSSDRLKHIIGAAEKLLSSDRAEMLPPSDRPGNISAAEGLLPSDRPGNVIGAAEMLPQSERPGKIIVAAEELLPSDRPKNIGTAEELPSSDRAEVLPPSDRPGNIGAAEGLLPSDRPGDIVGAAEVFLPSDRSGNIIVAAKELFPFDRPRNIIGAQEV